jgi:hypothetical protein
MNAEFVAIQFATSPHLSRAALDWTAGAAVPA